jgi:hypothetical protein
MTSCQRPSRRLKGSRPNELDEPTDPDRGLMINNGVIESSCGPDLVVRFHYDPAVLPAGPNQPLINGPRGFCLDVTNVTGRRARVIVSGLTGNPLNVVIAQGDPVTSGPSRSRTAAQMAQLGFTTRGSVGNISLTCDSD